MAEGQHRERLRHALRQRLEGWQRSGVTHLKKPTGVPVSLTPGSTTPSDLPPAPNPSPALAETQSTLPTAPSSAEETAAAHAASESSIRPAAVDAPPSAAAAPQRSLLGDTEEIMPRRAAGSEEVSTASDIDRRRALPPLERQQALDRVRRRVIDCQRCQELACTRTQTVFGVGNIAPRLCFLGEAPGADEDAQGEPFVGRAGQLLTRIIEACTLRREDVYILNVLKCRPPGNRTPLPDEAANCREYLEAQLELLQPEFICCLGAVAAKTLLNSTLSMGKLRGKFYRYRGIRVLCTYHPAYLLRNPAAKRDVWEDMQLLMAEMDIALPPRAGGA